MYDTIFITFLIIFLIILYIIYLIHSRKCTYQIIDKFSVPVLNEIEYYFVLKQDKKNNKIKVNVQKEMYDSHELYDLIVIL
jgi:hypothetical protein